MHTRPSPNAVRGPVTRGNVSSHSALGIGAAGLGGHPGQEPQGLKGARKPTRCHTMLLDGTSRRGELAATETVSPEPGSCSPGTPGPGCRPRALTRSPAGSLLTWHHLGSPSSGVGMPPLSPPLPRAGESPGRCPIKADGILCFRWEAHFLLSGWGVGCRELGWPPAGVHWGTPRGIQLLGPSCHYTCTL